MQFRELYHHIVLDQSIFRFQAQCMSLWRMIGLIFGTISLVTGEAYRVDLGAQLGSYLLAIICRGEEL